MEEKSKKENTDNFSQKLEQEQEQIKFYSENDTEIFSDHQIIKEILSSDTTQEEKEPEIEQEEIAEQISFDEFLKIPEGKHPDNTFQEIQTEAPDIDIPMHEEPQQKSHAELVNEITVQDIQLRFQDEVLPPMDTSEIERELNKQERSVPRQSSSVFKVKKSTKRAFYVLKDIFGDIETEENKSEVQEYEVSSRKKFGALFFAISLGFLGAHRLYLGQYKKVPAYLIIVGFWWLSEEFLPDLGLANMLFIVVIFWVIADILAIIFSRKIPDGKNRIVERWI